MTDDLTRLIELVRSVVDREPYGWTENARQAGARKRRLEREDREAQRVLSWAAPRLSAAAGTVRTGTSQ